jgi:GTPase KRas protein
LQYIRAREAFLLVYSIASKPSFDEIPALRDQILRVKDADKVPTVIVGNKCDLEQERAVSTPQGRELAAKAKCPFLETSAKARINVDECFFELVREIRRSKNQDSGKKTKEKKRGCSIL